MLVPVPVSDRRATRRRSVARIATLAVFGIVALSAGAGAAGAAPTPSSGASGSTSGSAGSGGSAPQPVLVVLRDQLAQLPAVGATVGARARRATAEQAAVLADLAGPAAANVHHFVVGNTVAATVTVAQAAQLRADPRVADVVADSTSVTTAPTTVAGTARPQVHPTVTPAARAVPTTACTGTQADPQLEPEGLSVINARSDDPSAVTAASLGLDGTGVKVAFIADGVDPDNIDFRRTDGTSAIVDQQVFTDGASNNGGGEAFGDAGTIAAQGLVAHDLADVVNPGAVTLPGGHCWIRVSGVAPGVDVVALNGLGGASFVPELQSIDYAVTVAHVDVINESFGLPIYSEGNVRNAIIAANSAAVAAGVTVVVSSGDAGINGTIGTPAAGPDVIAVGATTHLRAAVQSGQRGALVAGTGWSNDQISDISSSGITSNGRTVDLVAPGDGGWAPCSTDLTHYSECANEKPNGAGAALEFFAGTSQAAPFTSGTAALVIQAYRRTHSGQSPTPALVKQFLTGTADDLGAPADLQGAGRLDARAAVEAALDWTGATAATPGTTPHLIDSPTALTYVGGAGTQPAGQTVTVHNTGASAVALTPAVRTLTPSGHSVATVAITHGSLGSTFVDGDSDSVVFAYGASPFVVAPGTGFMRIGVSGVSASAGADPADQLGPQISVYDPAGRLAATTTLQGPFLSRSEVTLNEPTAGTWTAIAYVPDGQTINSVQVSTESYQWQSHNWVSPASATVAAGATASFAVTPTIPVTDGDATATVTFGTSAAATIPIVLRSALRPTASAPAPFSVTLRGGNGRDSAPSQTASYLIDVPDGHRQLTADFSAVGCGCALYGLLIDPTGEVLSTGTGFDLAGNLGERVHQTVSNPVAGAWRFVLLTGSQISRAAPTTLATGRIALDAGLPTASGLPTSPTTKLVADRATKVTITVPNPGAQALPVQIDAQRTGLSTFALAPTGSAAVLDLPADGDVIAPTVLPPNTVSATVSLTASTPTQVGLLSNFLGTQVVGAPSAPGQPSVATISSPGQGIWLSLAVPVGPFGPAGAPSGTAALATTVVAPAFDTRVTSPGGYSFYAGVDPNTPSGHVPVVAPGGTTRITVTITPRASDIGHTISGNVVVSSSGNQLPDNSGVQAAGAGFDVIGYLPYSYRVVAAVTPPKPVAPPKPEGGGPELANTGAGVQFPLLLALSGCVAGVVMMRLGRRRTI